MSVTGKFLSISLAGFAALASTVGAEEPSDDSQIDKVTEEFTQALYEAYSSRPRGDKAGYEGWPEEMQGLKIRFIRLSHEGQGWDDGMDESAADVNVVQAFAKIVGQKATQRGEGHSIALLKKYPKDGFPPFVFLTGSERMGRVSVEDLKILREYCLKGGMLIANAGGPDFHASFLEFMRQVFPEKKLFEIAADDSIYQFPNPLPDGAPPLRGPGGGKPLGIREGDRLIVFYHPGDMNDAWKSPKFTDATPEMRKANIELGANLLYYAFNHWFSNVYNKDKNQPAGDPANVPAPAPHTPPKPSAIQAIE